MDQVTEFFSGIFDTSQWPPRWHCGRWSDFHGWLYIISDLMIFSAYFAIPVIILRYVARRTNTRFHKIYFLFAAFILACGFTHLLDAVSFWYPYYRFSALVRLFTGVVSWVTVYYLFKMLPVAFSLRTAEELQAEVDQRRKAEEDLKFRIKLLNDAQEIARLGHWEWNIPANKITWSDNLYRIYGLQPRDTGISYDEYVQCIHPDDRAHVRSHIEQVMATGMFEDFYHRIITPSGEMKIMHARGEVITDGDGRIIRMMGTGQDITHQENTEQALLIKSSELEKKNAELEKFAYIASHDLQEPLRKIRTFISRLQDDSIEPGSDRSKLYMEKVVNAAERMHNLVDDILNFSRLSAGEVRLEPTDLNQVLATVLGDMEVVIEQYGAIVQSDNLPVIEANITQMTQLFQNLISNAIKFRKEDVPPFIRVTSELLTGPQIKAPDHILAHYKFAGWRESRQWTQERFWSITVTDNGIGFDVAYAERIFEAFQRLDTVHEGTGIGLAICKKIVENHNGYIRAESAQDKGARFIIVLPVSQANFEHETMT